MERHGDYVKEATGTNDLTHNIMRDYYINIIKTGLRDFDNSQHIDSFYEAFAWEGVKDFATPAELAALGAAKTALRSGGLGCD